MKSGRRAPVSTQQALLGTVLLVLAVFGIIRLADILRLPALELPPLDAPELEDEDRRPGEVTCPTGEDVQARGIPVPVTSFELIECPELFDGKIVEYEGEAVGAVLLRDDHAWLHLNDDPYGLSIGPLSRHRTAVGGNSGMAVSVPRASAVGVTVGGYRRQGTGVAVTGTYRRNHPLDGGAPGILADEVRIIRDPETFSEPVSTRRIIAAAVLLVLVAALAGVKIYQRRLEHSV